MVTFDKDKLVEQIKALRKLPPIKEVRALVHRLEKELEKLTRKEIPIPKPTREEKRVSANRKRRGKMKRYHNYIRQIRNNYPNFSYQEVRKQLSLRKKGFDTNIPDAIWQNPSP